MVSGEQKAWVMSLAVKAKLGWPWARRITGKLFGDVRVNLRARKFIVALYPLRHSSFSFLKIPGLSA